MLVGKILITAGIICMVPVLFLIIKGLYMIYRDAIEKESLELFCLATVLTGCILLCAGTLCLKLADTHDASQSEETSNPNQT